MLIVSSFRALRGHLGFVAGLALLALSHGPLEAQTNTPSAADGFDPNVNGTVFAVATQTDGKILIAGTFDTVGGLARTNLARLNIDGSVDQSFTLGANDKVTSVGVQADGKIVIGGYFTSLQPNGGAATTRNRVARLNADGSVDAGFNPNLGGVLAPGVEALVIQGDGKVVVGGTFTTAQPTGASTATTRNRLARFNADGSLDAAFNPNVDRTVLALALQGDGKIIVGGGFTKLQPNGAAAATSRNALARLNPDGSLDDSYDPNANNGVTKVVVQADGKVIAGGYFTTVAPNGAGGYTTVSHIARFNTDGSYDTAFNPSISGNIMALAVQSNGGVLIGGTFASVQSTRRTYVARLNPDGTLDNVFDPSTNYTVFAIAEQSDGSILLAGNFTQLRPNFANAPTTRRGLARINLNGTLDSDFSPDTNGRVLALLVQPDGKALLGGSFTSLGGVTRNFVARLNVDGTLDTGFDPNLNGQVNTLALQADGKILVGGGFTTVKGAARLRLARLNADGTLDGSFEPNPDSAINAIAVQSDGKILIGGYFTSLRPNGSADLTVMSRLARLNSDGSIDSTFNPAPGGPVLAIKLQTDGKILVGGNFLGFATGNRANLARINTDGTLDSTYNPLADRQVNAIVLQSDGKIVIGGSFTFLQPVNAPVVTTTTTNADGTKTTTTTTTSFRRGLARINSDGTVDPTYDPSTNDVVRSLALQADGKIVVGGLFSELTPNSNTVGTTRRYVARINTDGTLDSAFDLGVGERAGNQVIALAVQADGKLLMGGAFTTLQPAGTATAVTRNQFARINANGSVDTSYTPSAGGPTGSVINSLTVQADGRVLLGGSFATFGGTSSNNLARFTTESVPDSSFNPDANGPVNTVAARMIGGAIGTQLGNFAWLNSDGTLRTSFRPSAQISGQISALAVQLDGKVLLAGSLRDLSGATSGNIVRLNADGSLDASFNPVVDSTINAMALQSDGKIVIGGAFLNVGGVSRQYIARINADGSLDTAFNPNANSSVNALLIQPDGYIVLGGSFNTLQPNGATATSAVNYLARIKGDGSFDSTFGPNPNSTVYAIAREADGSLVVGGAFSTIFASSSSTTLLTRNHVARIKPDNSTDATFDPGVSGNVLALAVQADGKIVLGGNFNFLKPNGSASIITRNNLARVNSDGTLDATYDPNFNGAVVTLAKQADGKIIAGGIFTTVQPPGATNPSSRNRLVRLNTDGSLDGTFDPNPSGAVVTISAQSDGSVLVGGIFTTVEPSGSILVGGSFSSIGGVALSNLALLNTGGSASASFAPNPNGAVSALAVRPDNRVVVAGSFTTIAGVARPGVAQLAASGAIDAAFSASASASGGPAVLLLQPDGKVLVGGTAVGFGGAARGTLERLNADGTLDASFNPSGLGEVKALALQPDGRILVGGAAPSRLVRLNTDGTADGSFSPAANGTVNSLLLQSDGRIIVGGAFTSVGGAAIGYLARLEAGGSADLTFNPNVNGPVTTAALQLGGKVLFGGSFSSVGGQVRYSLARVAMTAPALQSLAVDTNLSVVTWTRSGSGPALTAAVFEQSVDGRTWTTLGQASRMGVADTWQLTGQSLPTGALLYLRARGVAVTSQYSSSGLVETVRLFYPSAQPRILSAPMATATTGSNFYYGVLTNVAHATFKASGLPSGLSIDADSGIISGTTLEAGVFPVAVTITNATGPATSTLMLVTQAPGSGPMAVRFANLSARAQITAADPLIAGLVIGGSTSQTVLLRAVGPGLAPYGVSTGIAHPKMQLFDAATGALVVENAGWGGNGALAAVFNQVGAFPLPADSADAALLVSLAPGAYSVVVTNATGGSGVALAEVYDTGADVSVTAPRLVNLSARASANSGENTLIGGFVVSGTGSKRILLRGAGPTLAGYGVTAAMANPVLSLHDVNGSLLAQNDNWGTPVTVAPSQPAASAADLSLAATQAGAFAFGAGSADAAVIVTLAPGTYSVQVKSATNTGGTALVEVYELP